MARHKDNRGRYPIAESMVMLLIISYLILIVPLYGMWLLIKYIYGEIKRNWDFYLMAFAVVCTCLLITIFLLFTAKVI